MDYRQVDERYFVAETRGGEKNLVIRDVKPTDAGNFTALEVFSGQSALVNLVVTGKLTPFLCVNIENYFKVTADFCRSS